MIGIMIRTGLDAYTSQFGVFTFAYWHKTQKTVEAEININNQPKCWTDSDFDLMMVQFYSG